jgi:RNA polymerase-associated protein CTR9
VFDGLLVKKVPNVEAYAALSLGNICKFLCVSVVLICSLRKILRAFSDFANLHVSEKRYGKHLQYAADFYKGILGKDPANAYAANGIGTVLAEKGEIFKAKEVFNRVREVSDDTIADALLNLGHIYLAQKKNSEALQLYQQYLTRIEDTNTPVTSKSRLDDIVDVLLYIAFAYFDWARHKELLNDAGAAAADGIYKKAMEHLEKGISRHPKKEVVLKYNLAMTKLQAANCVLQKLTRNIARTVEEVQEALDGLQESLVVVEQILEDKNENKKVPIPTSTLQNFLTHCRANITSAKSHLEDEKQRAAEAEAEQEIRRLAVEAEMKEAELEEAIRKEQEAKEQEERDRKAEATMQKVATLRDNWQKEQQAELVEKEKKKKRSGAAGDMADFIEEDKPEAGGGGHGLFDDSDESDEEEAGPEDKPKHVPDQKELFGDSEEEDSDKPAGSPGNSMVAANKAPTPSKNELFGDSDDSDEESAESPTKNAPEDVNAKKPGSKELFGSDDESDEELLEVKRESEGQPRKKRSMPEEDEDEGESAKRQNSKGLFGSDDESDEELLRDSDDPQPKKRRLLDDNNNDNDG